MRARSIRVDTPPISLRVGVALAALMFAGCSGTPELLSNPPAPSGAGAGDAGSVDATFGFGDGGPIPLRVNDIDPDHGPFVGGNSAIVRGSGFVGDVAAGEVEVLVGGNMVQPADTEIMDPSRIAIVLPAGEPGPADVTVRVRGSEATLSDGYVYDAFYVTPARGATSGGTFLEILGDGTSFAEGDAFEFGGWPCTELEVITPGRATCRAPAGAVGEVDVTHVPAEGDELTVEDAYEYYDSSDPFRGGLGGGPIDGSIHVTVIDAQTGLAVPDAFVYLGDEPETTEHQGLTSVMGNIAFSGPGVVAPATVTVAKHCYEKTSFVAFDARDVTVFLYPWLDPMCGDPGDPPLGGAGRNGSFVSGELVFLGPNEYGPNPWDNIPPPRDGWERVAYVYATQRCAGDGGCRNPDPGLGGSTPRVLEMPLGEMGYPYRIFVRPSAFAVYALAGLENRATGEFLPYVMGVARNVLAGPGEERTNVDILMNIPLDHYLDITLQGVPGPGRNGPDRFVVGADIDLGGEGLVVRRARGERVDVSRQRGNERAFRFFAQPALYGALSDGRYRIEASWVTGDSESDPSTNVVVQGIREVDAEVVIDGFVGIPVATAPEYGARLPEDRVLRWESSGGNDPDFWFVRIIGGDGNPAWRLFVPGTQTEAPIPNLAAIPEIDDISPGFLQWDIYAIHIPGFDFDNVTYSDLNRSRWRAWATDFFTAQR